MASVHECFLTYFGPKELKKLGFSNSDCCLGCHIGDSHHCFAMSQNASNRGVWDMGCLSHKTHTHAVWVYILTYIHVNWSLPWLLRSQLPPMLKYGNVLGRAPLACLHVMQEGLPTSQSLLGTWKPQNKAYLELKHISDRHREPICSWVAN